MSSSREHLRLSDIIEEIDAIQGYVGAMTLEEFSRTRMVSDATERCLERIIEATIKIGKDRMSQIAPELPFDQLRGFGNRFRHAYNTIEAAPIFAIISDELPKLKSARLIALGS